MKKNFNIICLFFIIVVMSISTGFALYNRTLTLNGNLDLAPNGIFSITNIQVLGDEFVNVQEPYMVPIIENNNVSFSVTAVSKDVNCTVVYLFEFTNDSFYDRAITGIGFSASVEGGEDAARISSELTYYDTGEIFNPGDIIHSKEVKRVKVKLSFVTHEAGQTIDIGGDVVTTVDDTGELLASLSGTAPFTGDLRDGNIECYNVSVASTYGYVRNIEFESSKNSITIVDSTGAALGIDTIDANETKTFEVCTKQADDAVFLSDSTSTNLYVKSGSLASIDCGEITFQVDPSTDITDEVPPEITDVQAVMKSVASDGSKATIGLSWELTDTTGMPQSDVKKYYVYVCKSATNCTLANSNGYNINNVDIDITTEGNYFFKVYGIDELNHNGYDDSNCQTDNNYCKFSTTTNYKWKYTVTLNKTNLNVSGATTAYAMNDYSCTYSQSDNNYVLPDSITVKVGNTTLSSPDDYSYDSSTGKVVIKGDKITDNVTVSATGTYQCLIEGSKVRLANGIIKNVEDVNYDDLLEVYDHDNGGLTYVYPIWIEKEHHTNKFIRISFSDDSYLDIAYGHGLYSLDENKYVTTLSSTFGIGTRVAKVDNNGNIIEVKVTSINTYNEPKSYYHISSTRYHNIIANDLLTTDSMVYASNMFKYDDKITWTEERNKYLATNDIFYWKDWSQFFPEYIFEGFRMPEAKTLVYQGVLDVLEYSINLNTLVKEPIKDKFGNYLWMVTTSDDIVTNKSDYYIKANDYYTLKEPINKDNFIGWLNTSDNKIYEPGDSIRVIYGNHFIAQYNK